MRDSSALIARLWRIAAGEVPAAAACVDARSAQDLARAQLHDLYTVESEDAPSGAGFGIAAALAAGAVPRL